uniref:Immunoglobulin V-set domain-containing protein n=1 Tax=Gopherus evgoodei TaxID=1825980 RepID=A0A8C4WQX9_9SAUR
MLCSCAGLLLLKTSQELIKTVQLACVLSREVSISDSYIRWYQQKQGEKPRYLLYYKDDSTQGKGSGVPDRFTASKDTSRHTCFLTISRAQAEDDADYYSMGFSGRRTHLCSDTTSLP